MIDKVLEVDEKSQERVNESEGRPRIQHLKRQYSQWEKAGNWDKLLKLSVPQFLHL